MRSSRTASLAVTAALLCLVAAGCGSDDGATVRELEGGGGGSGSAGSAASGSGSAASGSAAASGAAAAAVPPGVAAQYTQLAREIKENGGQTESGPWRIGYIVEPAEPWFESVDGEYRFRQPAPGETHHIEIIPFEKSTGRVVPEVPIRVEVVGADGQVVDARDLNFYYSTFFHYATNFAVPDPGRYTLRVTLGPPQFLRHGEQAQGPALPDGTRVEFTNVALDPPA
ncbi:MAG: hypothetical protein GEV09_24230 [Pseudonocardiaceae bacterium]|nr:hypothetical protein [Pseudonocardiaceae bacterium]